MKIDKLLSLFAELAPPQLSYPAKTPKTSLNALIYMQLLITYTVSRK